MFALDYLQESYSQILAIGNFVAFAGLIGCIVLLYVTAFLGQFDRHYKQIAVGTLIYIVSILVAHCVLVEHGITLLVPPIGTPYFAEFMHTMQYISSVSFVSLFSGLPLLKILKVIGSLFKGQPLLAWIYLFILLVLQGYIYDSFGISLLFSSEVGV